MNNLTSTQVLSELIEDTLSSGDSFLYGIQTSGTDVTKIAQALIRWCDVTNDGPKTLLKIVEPCLRQSIVMALLPSKGLDITYTGSIEAEVRNHLQHLNIQISDSSVLVLRDICVHARSLFGLTSGQARRRVSSMATLRGDQNLYNTIINRQGGRCVWCGVVLNNSDVQESLEHMAPKHIGGDSSENWGIACVTCNNGKGAVLAWSTTPAAHGMLGRKELESPYQIAKSVRWVVLVRDGACISCQKTAVDVELWAAIRVPTGVPIPALCFTTCSVCAGTNQYVVPSVQWESREVGRTASQP